MAPSNSWTGQHGHTAEGPALSTQALGGLARNWLSALVWEPFFRRAAHWLGHPRAVSQGDIKGQFENSAVRRSGTFPTCRSRKA